MPRGLKLCNKCLGNNGPRSLKCKHCSASFTFKKDVEGISLAQMRARQAKETPQPSFDWRELKRGDRIKVVQSTGPYLPRENDDPIHVGYAGKFTVLGLGKDVIHATGNKREGDSAHCVIYVGPEMMSEYGVYRVPHKIIKLKPRKEKV